MATITTTECLQAAIATTVVGAAVVTDTIDVPATIIVIVVNIDDTCNG